MLSLDIRGNLSPEQFITLFEKIKNNNIIKELILRWNNFKCDLKNEDIYFGLSNLLQNNKNIKALTLYHTNIQNNGIKALA